MDTLKLIIALNNVLRYGDLLHLYIHNVSNTSYILQICTRHINLNKLDIHTMNKRAKICAHFRSKLLKRKNNNCSWPNLETDFNSL